MIWFVIILVLVVAGAAAALVLVPARRRVRLRARFGPEYEVAVARHGERRAAERELIERQKRFGQLDVRPLGAEARAAHTARWTAAQERFVDEPAAAVADAEEIVRAVMLERGYPDAAGDERLALLSVEHSRALAHYRAALVLTHEGTPGTEDLRRALLHLRVLFTDLAGTATPAAAPAAPARPAA